MRNRILCWLCLLPIVALGCQPSPDTAPDETALAAVAPAGPPQDPGTAVSANSTAYKTNVEGNREVAPGFDVALMEGVGHFLMLECPQELNRLLAEAVAAVENRPAM